jgi:N-alpha-acetyltransferase 15/16, NatA auxiliary subunit
VPQEISQARSSMQTGKALDMLQQCMQHTPTLVELYTLKAKILKHAGDVEGAAAAADKARSMDLADRCCCNSAAYI